MPEIQVFNDEKELGRAAAREFLEYARARIDRKGLFTVALSGGRGPREFYRNLASARGELEWEKVYFFWGDERMVPPAEAESNYGSARRLFLDKLGLPESNIHRVRGEERNPEKAAQDYAREMKEFFNTAPGEFPGFDLVLLGLGADGHIASLLPGSPALQEAEQAAVQVFFPALGQWRVTLTPPVFNAAGRVIFLALGVEKAGMLLETLRGERRPEQYPAQLIRPKSKEVLWMVDAAAAGALK